MWLLRTVLFAVGSFTAGVIPGCSRRDSPARVAPAATGPLACEAWVGSIQSLPVGLQHRDRYGLGSQQAPAWHEPGPSWQLPRDVRLDVTLASVSSAQIVVHAVLTNASASPQEVFLVTPGLGLSATLQGEGVDFLPSPPAQTGSAITPPPHLFPEPSLYVLPAGARWTFDATIDLRCWHWRRGQTASVLWSFPVAGSSLHGAQTVAMP